MMETRTFPRRRDVIRVATPALARVASQRRALVAEIAREHRFEAADLMAPDGTRGGNPGSRARAIFLARAHAMWAIRFEFGDSYPQIGQMFGGRHHTAVMHAVRRWKAVSDAAQGGVE